MWTKENIDKVVKDNKIVVFGKGTKEQPMCGFTHRADRDHDADRRTVRSS